MRAESDPIQPNPTFRPRQAGTADPVFCAPTGCPQGPPFTDFRRNRSRQFVSTSYVTEFFSFARSRTVISSPPCRPISTASSHIFACGMSVMSTISASIAMPPTSGARRPWMSAQPSLRTRGKPSPYPIGKMAMRRSVGAV